MFGRPQCEVDVVDEDYKGNWELKWKQLVG